MYRTNGLQREELVSGGGAGAGDANSLVRREGPTSSPRRLSPLVIPDHVDDPPPQLGMAEELDGVDAAPLDVGIVGRGARFVGAPGMGDVAEQVDAAARFDLVE